jgi:hypothetical protein
VRTLRRRHGCGVIELIRWRDSHFSLDDDQDGDDYLVETVGWTKPDGKFLRIEGEHLPGDDSRAVSRIPYENIVARIPLEPVPHPAVLPYIESSTDGDGASQVRVLDGKRR